MVQRASAVRKAAHRCCTRRLGFCAIGAARFKQAASWMTVFCSAWRVHALHIGIFRKRRCRFERVHALHVTHIGFCRRPRQIAQEVSLMTASQKALMTALQKGLLRLYAP